MTQPKPPEDLIRSSAVKPLEPIGRPLDPFDWDYDVVQSGFRGTLALRAHKWSEGFNVWTSSTGSHFTKVLVVGTGDDPRHFIEASEKEVYVLPASAAFRAQAEGSRSSSAQFTLDALVQSDADRLWANGHVALEEDNLENVKQEFGLFLKRHGEAGVRTLSRLLLSRVPSGQTAWVFLQMIGESVDVNTAQARRDVLAAALESRDAGLRYAAATALGDFGGADAIRALRRRLDWEKNISVRRVIEAELRK